MRVRRARVRLEEKQKDVLPKEGRVRDTECARSNKSGGTHLQERLNEVLHGNDADTHVDGIARRVRAVHVVDSCQVTAPRLRGFVPHQPAKNGGARAHVMRSRGLPGFASAAHRQPRTREMPYEKHEN